MIIILPSIREAPLLLSLLVHRIAEAIYTAVPKYLWGNSASFKNLACIDPVLTVRIKALLELRSELDCRSADAENVRICAELLNLSLSKRVLVGLFSPISIQPFLPMLPDTSYHKSPQFSVHGLGFALFYLSKDKGCPNLPVSIFLGTVYLSKRVLVGLFSPHKYPAFPANATGYILP